VWVGRSNSKPQQAQIFDSVPRRPLSTICIVNVAFKPALALGFVRSGSAFSAQRRPPGLSRTVPVMNYERDGGFGKGVCLPREWFVASPENGSWVRRANGARHDWRIIVADNAPTEIQTLIENHINGFNTQNNKLFLSVFGDTAIIIDGIAPYRWLNPNAPAKWIADSDRWREDLGVSYENISYEMGFWNVEGSNAYAVVAGRFTVTIGGKTVVRTGTLAYTFSKHGEEWKIDAQAWGRTS
jgi:hypothetical protein